ncbi:MAG: hypothetical protein ACWIPJ_06290 [Polaribacter sp.]
MFFRVLSFVVLLFCCTSCDEFSFSKNKKNQTLDTIVNFSSVDTSPSFKICDTIIDKEQKTNCFRNTIHQKIGEELQQYQFTMQDYVSEVIMIDLIVSSKGKIILEKIESSKIIQKQLPMLDSILKTSFRKLPKIYPAIKRGIPVTTKYRLPIQIQLKE